MPRTPEDLTEHRCIKLRLISYGRFYVWEFERAGRKLNARVEGQLAFSSSAQVLFDWMPTFEGYQLYYPSRQHSAVFQLFVEAMRHRG